MALNSADDATVTMEERVYRAKVVEQFLQAGIPLSKVDLV